MTRLILKELRDAAADFADTSSDDSTAQIELADARLKAAIAAADGVLDGTVVDLGDVRFLANRERFAAEERAMLDEVPALQALDPAAVSIATTLAAVHTLVNMEIAERDARQYRFLEVAVNVFGFVVGEAEVKDPVEAFRYLLEEVFELGQVVGFPIHRVVPLAQHVYSRPVGELRQELGGVMLSMMKLAAIHGVSLARAEHAEFARVSIGDHGAFRERQAQKKELGL